MTKLQALKKELEEKVVTSESENTDQAEPIDLKSLEAFTAGLKALLLREEDPVIKSTIIQKIVERILVTKEGIEIYFNVGKDY